MHAHAHTHTHTQAHGSPQTGIKAEQVGVLGAEFVTTSIDSLAVGTTLC